MIKTTFFILAFVSLSQAELGCKLESNGGMVDWFTIYKLPKLPAKGDNLPSHLVEGTAYMYLSDKNPEWQVSELSMNDTISMPGQTLSDLYTNDPNIGYILYNDQADKVTLIRGHTKGVLLFDGQTVVWIVHSVPHFPPKASEKQYQIKPSQCIYGQSMLCMTFSFDEIKNIGDQLFYNYPQIFDSYIPENLKISKSEELQSLMRVIQGEHPKQQPWSSLKELTTKGGEKLISFAKFTDYNEDLYSGLVAPRFKSDLLTETWNNGPGTLKSNCSSQIEYRVMNIEQVKFGDIKFSVHRDHSKWAVTTTRTRGVKQLGDSHPAACVGDINRQEEQFKRSGGTICFVNNQQVWSQYHKLVDDIEPCSTIRLGSGWMNKIKGAWRLVKNGIWCAFSTRC